MSSPIITVENLSKRYHLGQIGATTLRESVERFLSRIRLRKTLDHRLQTLDQGGKGVDLRPETLDIRRNTKGQDVAATPSSSLKSNVYSLKSDDPQDLWALKDVSFEVQPGEVLGIIGRNGAGKSTLLKILSRITEPTSGRAIIRGRVASLLEVGTGFHPELTGRENIFLNGAILGMKKAEIARKFDEIVAFAEVERFIDTPVKRYSSGMYVRLAFAVAAHLEPEILVIDEVLAVGDASFQKKCLGKMSEVAHGGRTVLFVSHSMVSVRSLCGRCVWVDGGRIRRVGKSVEIIEEYLRSTDKSRGEASCEFPENVSKAFQLCRCRLLDEAGQTTKQFNCNLSVNLEMTCRVRRRVPGLYGYLQLSKLDGTEVLVSDSYDAPPNPLDALMPGLYRITIRVPARTLAPGHYVVYVSFSSIFGEEGFDVDIPGTVFTFNLTDDTSRRGDSRGGCFSSLLAWETKSLSEPINSSQEIPYA